MSRALVLGGGGPVGIAWEAGVLSGLAEGGIMAADADFIVGTSAGSVVGALVAMGREPGSIAAPIIAEADRPREIPGQVAENRPGAPNMMVGIKFMKKRHLKNSIGWTKYYAAALFCAGCLAGTSPDCGHRLVG